MWISAALAASSSVVVNKLLDSLEGKDSQNLTAEEKEARTNLITTLVTGVTAAVGGDAAERSTGSGKKHGVRSCNHAN